MVEGLLANIALFAGKHADLSLDEEEDGFLDAIVEKQPGHRSRVRQRLLEVEVLLRLVAALRAAERIRGGKIPTYRRHITDTLNRVEIAWPDYRKVAQGKEEDHVWLESGNADQPLLSALQEPG